MVIVVVLVWIVDCSISYWCSFPVVFLVVVVLVVDRWWWCWWWCWRPRFFSSSLFSIICAVGLRLLLWFVVWKIERDKDTAQKKTERERGKKEKGNCRRKRKESVRGYPTRVPVKERARWASFLSHTIIHIYESIDIFSFFLSFFFSYFFFFVYVFHYLNHSRKKNRKKKKKIMIVERTNDISFSFSFLC